MKKMILVVFGLLSFVFAFSQVTEVESDLKKKKSDTLDGWKFGGVFNAQFSQVSLNNWAAGGQNSISINSIASFFVHFKKGKNNWSNYLDLGYGLVKQGEEGSYIKSDDRIELTSIYGREATKHWFYSGLFNFRSQFTEGFNYPNDSVIISDFMAPGYFLGAIGMEYKKGSNLTLFIAPLTAKITVVNNQFLADQGAFGVDPAEFDINGVKIKNGSKNRTEVGGFIRLNYNRLIVENVTFSTNLSLFSNYENNPANIDVNWDNLISMKVNKYITATLSTSLIYDDDVDIQVLNDDGSPELSPNGEPIVGPRTQFKYVIGVGFSYSFGVKDDRK